MTFDQHTAQDIEKMLMLNFNFFSVQKKISKLGIYMKSPKNTLRVQKAPTINPKKHNFALPELMK